VYKLGRNLAKALAAAETESGRLTARERRILAGRIKAEIREAMKAGDQAKANILMEDLEAIMG